MPEKRFQDWMAALGAAWEWWHGRDLPLAREG
jgi:hypothetical protein